MNRFANLSLVLVAAIACLGGCSAPEDYDDEAQSADAVTEARPGAKVDLRWLTLRVTSKQYLYPTDDLEKLTVVSRPTRPVAGDAPLLTLKPRDVVRFELPPASFEYVTLHAFNLVYPETRVPTVMCAVDANGMGTCVDAHYEPYTATYGGHLNVGRDANTVALILAQKVFVDVLKSGRSMNPDATTAKVSVDVTWDVPRGNVVLPKPPR